MASSLPTTQQLLLTAAAMGSGGALIVTIITKVPLWETLLAFAVYGAFTAALLWARATAASRIQIARRLKAGLTAGALATVAYDASRYLLVTAASLKYWPFETFVIFGRSIAGEALTRGHAYAVGTLYHCVNGLFFAVAYAFLLGTRHWSWGVAFALVLEFTVFGLYPGWLNLASVMEEFTVVSLTGHVAYGVTLGLICSRRLRDGLPPSPIFRQTSEGSRT
jgi:hypothetical protein